MTIVFKIKSHEAYIFKILTELLGNNIKTGCFEIDNSGIYLRMMDHHKKILIDLKLDAKSSGFSIYKFESKKLFIGINMNHFHKMLKPIKKKDTIELYIDDETPSELFIKVTPKENNKTKISTVKIQSFQNLDIDLPSGYDNSISIPSADYQKMLKELSSIGNIIKINSKNFYIDFTCSAPGVYGSTIKFGDINEENENIDKEEYSQEFYTESLSRVIKLAGLSSNNIQIYPGKPLLFKSNVGSMGSVSVYIKSKEQIEKDMFVAEESDSDFE